MQVITILKNKIPVKNSHYYDVMCSGRISHISLQQSHDRKRILFLFDILQCSKECGVLHLFLKQSCEDIKQENIYLWRNVRLTNTLKEYNKPHKHKPYSKHVLITSQQKCKCVRRFNLVFKVKVFFLQGGHV